MRNVRMHFIGLAISVMQVGCAVDDDMEQDIEIDGQEQIASVTLASTSQCNNGRICFWDDNGFSDTFKYRTVSLGNFSDINFGDKTTSVWNRMTVAWLLYDDAGYSDTRVCVKAGASVTNLGNFGFNDKTSSAKKLTGNTCPSGCLEVFSDVN